MLLSILDAVAFSSVWVAAAAGALCAAASLAMGVTPAFSVAGIAVSGTLFVYNVDRLRDFDRDRATTPQRSASANAIASNVRDAEAAVVRFGRGPVLNSARLFAALGLLLVGALLAVGWQVS